MSCEVSDRVELIPDCQVSAARTLACMIFHVPQKLLENTLERGLRRLQEWESIRGDRGLTGVDHAGHLTGAREAIVWQIGYG